MAKLTLTSKAFKNEEEIPIKYTCQGESINPPLNISNVPEKTQSLALTTIDIDPPIGKTITHWILCNMEPTTLEIPENASLEGIIVGKNMRRQNKYMGPCPPKGSHRYVFTLYALDTKLSVDSKVNKKTLLKAIEGHVLEKAELIGTYTKKKK